MKERWTGIDGFPSHEVSSSGRLRHLHGNRKIFPGHVYPQCVKRDGHIYYTLHHRGKRRMVSAHRLVMEVYGTPCPGRVGTGAHDYQVNHKNGIKTDNRLSNLEWVTPREQTRHAVRMGLFPHGSRHGGAKLSEQEVRHIKALLRNSCVTHAALARTFGVTAGAISSIATGRNWRHI